MCYIRGPRLTKIKAQKGCALLIIERLIDGKIAKIKEDVTHSGVFPIEDPDLMAVVDKVAGKQIVVARMGIMQRPNGIFDLCHQCIHLGKRIRKCYPALNSLLVVIPHGLKWRECAGKIRTMV